MTVVSHSNKSSKRFMSRKAYTTKCQHYNRVMASPGDNGEVAMAGFLLMKHASPICCIPASRQWALSVGPMWRGRTVSVPLDL